MSTENNDFFFLNKQLIILNLKLNLNQNFQFTLNLNKLN